MHKKLKLLFLLLSLQVVPVLPMTYARNAGRKVMRPVARIAQNVVRHKKLYGIFAVATGASAYVSTKLFRACHEHAQRPQVGAHPQSLLQRLVGWFRPVQQSQSNRVRPVIAAQPQVPGGAPEVIAPAVPVQQRQPEVRPVVVHPVGIVNVDEVQRAGVIQDLPAGDVEHRDAGILPVVALNQDNPLIGCDDLLLRLIASHLPLADAGHMRRVCSRFRNLGVFEGRVTLNYSGVFRPDRRWFAAVRSDPNKQLLQRMEKEYTQCMNGRVAVTLNFSRNYCRDIVPIVPFFARIPAIKGLELSNAFYAGQPDGDRSNNIVLQAVCQHFQELEELDLSINSFFGLPSEIAQLRQLRKLNIAHCHFRPDALAEIFAWLPQLEELDLSSNGIFFQAGGHALLADQLIGCLREIAQIERQQRLTIDLRNNGIPEAVQAAIQAELARHPDLNVIF